MWLCLDSASAQSRLPVLFRTNDNTVAQPTNFWQKVNSHLMPYDNTLVYDLGSLTNVWRTNYINALAFWEPTAPTWMTFITPNPFDSNYTLTLPPNAGTNGQYLYVDSVGRLYWGTLSAGGESNWVREFFTNATRLGFSNGKTNNTNFLKTVSVGYGLVVTNQGTNIESSVDSSVISSRSELLSSSNAIVLLVGETNWVGEASVTNANRIGLVAGKVANTNLLRSIQAGNGIILTNEGTNIVIASDFTSSVVQTNFVMNQIYTNTSLTPVFVRASAYLISAAVNGVSSIDLMYSVSGGTNYARIDRAAMSTVITGFAIQTTNQTISAVITNQGNYYFTNTSSGAGNSAGVDSGTGQITILGGGATGPVGPVNVITSSIDDSSTRSNWVMNTQSGRIFGNFACIEAGLRTVWITNNYITTASVVIISAASTNTISGLLVAPLTHSLATGILKIHMSPSSWNTVGNIYKVSWFICNP